MSEPTVTCVDIEGNEYTVPVGKLSWRPSAYGIVIKDGAVLLSKQLGGFDLPGGGLDFGETPEQAVIREVKEETGIDVANPHLIGVASSLFKLPTRDKDEFIQSIMMYYICDFVGGEFSIDGFDEYEKQYGDMPEWISLPKLDTIKMASSVDYRPYIEKSVRKAA